MTVPGETAAERAKALMDRLRKDCPWDRAQTFQSIRPYTIEEAYEVAEAIDQDDMISLKSELGDLLFQVLFHAKLAEERGAFNFDDVCNGLVDKMVSRHPHVFEGADKPDWDTIKAAERKITGETRTLDGVALALPALARSEKLAKRAARRGFDWPDVTGVTDKIHEEIDEFVEAAASGSLDAMEDEMGDVLFSVANLARHYGLDPEAALRRTNAKFTQRFNAVEDNAAKPLEDLSLDEMEALWQAAKESGL